MKKILAALGLSSIGGFITVSDKITHFARFEMLVGSRVASAEAAASESTYDAIHWFAKNLTTVTSGVFDYRLLFGALALVIATAALWLAREHRLDCALLLTVIVASGALLLAIAAPWLRVANVLQDRALWPQLIKELQGDTYIARQARMNWACVICAHMSSDEYKEFTCPPNMTPVAARKLLEGQVAKLEVFTLVLVLGFVGLFWARGDWLKIEAGAGVKLAVLAILSVVAYVMLAGNAYSIAYIRGKADADTKCAQYSKTIEGQTVTGFALSASEKLITFMSTISNVETVDAGTLISLNTSADILDLYLTQIAKQTKHTKKEMNATPTLGARPLG